MLFSTRAPAKVNLVLRVGPRRPDGYHDIDSLFVPLDLADDVFVSIRPGRSGPVSCHCENRPDLDGHRNLAAKAALAFRAWLGIRDRCEIRIVKRVPVTAGLGGGSSDAAAVLRCLARAFAVRDNEGLAKIAARIGSDVPFFLGKGAAWVAGRGELVTPTKVAPLHLLLAFPRDPTSSIRAADAYGWLDQDRLRRGRIEKPTGRQRNWTSVEPSKLVNDLQAVCLAHRPRVEKLIQRLEGEGAARAIMSGSGPTVFGLFADRKAARCAARAMGSDRAESASLDLLVARTMQRQPGVLSWKSPRSASSRLPRKSSRPT